MNTKSSVSFRHQRLLGLFAAPPPRLWCPLLTFYTSKGAVDLARMQAHQDWVSQWISSFLVPGSTGDAWELQDEEALTVMECTASLCATSNAHLLIGLLKPSVDQALALLEKIFTYFGVRSTGQSGASSAARFAQLKPRRICGITVCPASGSISQEEMRTGLARVLDLGIPTALYQLPQVTKNEISVSLVESLLESYSNLLIFKDSSGTDRMAQHLTAARDLFLLRGAEGEYARWLKPQGPYSGFLLSTANCFPRELHEMVGAMESGDNSRAESISNRITEVVRSMFALVAGLPAGNPFTNANKAMDHWLAFGPAALKADAPRLHAGVTLPVEVLRATGDILTANGFDLSRPYLR